MFLCCLMSANIRLKELLKKNRLYAYKITNIEFSVFALYPLDENSLMIMQPAEAHKPRITGKEKYERYAVNFPVSFAETIDPEGRLVKAFTERPLGKNNMFNAEHIDTLLVKKLFSEMCQDIADYDRQLTIKTHLLILLDMINCAYSNQESTVHTPRNTAERIISYVNSHLSDNISVPDLAEHFHLSTSQFSRIFRQATGAAPWEYITKKRLTAAKEKIRSGCTAQEACELCGFNDYSAFYRAYTKHFGRSPKEKE